MSSLALILNDLKNEILGYDVFEFFTTQIELEKRNIKIINNIEYNEEYIYIIGNAFKTNGICEEIYNNYKYYFYNDFIEFYFKDKYKIAVSGTHGKTTTTSLLSHFIPDASYLIGDGTGKGIENSKYFIFEACEYKNTFLKYNPDILVITNIDLDHIDFFSNIDNIINSFNILASQSNIVIINNNCNNSRKIKSNNKITFGKTNSDYIYYIIDDKNGYDICIKCPKQKYYYYHLDFYGEYMIENFMCNFIVIDILNIDKSNMNDLILNFKMPKRRMNEIKIKDKIFISDYGHHPAEIEVTIKSIKKKYPNYKLYTIFEPHTYTRFQYFLKETLKALSYSDFYYIVEIFSSIRENKFNNELDKYVNFDEKILEEILKIDKVIILFIGAGNIDKLFLKTIEKLSK